MRPCTIAAAALAGVLLAAQAFASNTIVGNPRSFPAATTRFTLFGALSLPVGEFAGTSSSVAGFTRTGAGLGLECSSRHTNEFEVGAMILVDRIPIDIRALEASYPGSAGWPGTGVASSAAWQAGWGLVGLGYSPRAGEHVRASVDLYGGALLVEFPGLTLVSRDYSLDYEASAWIGPAVGIGANIRWRDHARLGLLYLSEIGRPGREYSNPTHLPVSTLHVTLGYTFGH